MLGRSQIARIKAKWGSDSNVYHFQCVWKEKRDVRNAWEEGKLVGETGECIGKGLNGPEKIRETKRSKIVKEMWGEMNHSTRREVRLGKKEGDFFLIWNCPNRFSLILSSLLLHEEGRMGEWYAQFTTVLTSHSANYIHFSSPQRLGSGIFKKLDLIIFTKTYIKEPSL